MTAAAAEGVGVRNPGFHVVTGAFSYTGQYIARRLLDAGHEVRTLTSHPDHPRRFAHRVSVAPYSFDDPIQLADSLRGATTLYNTYWIRFPQGRLTYDAAVANSERLFKAAKEAGVRRIVHISVTNADQYSPLPYFRCKGVVEDLLQRSGLSYAIIRPALIFGPEDILINNIAWLLRRCRVFAIPGSGAYELQPIAAEDLAEIAVNAGQGDGQIVLDAVGPETFTFNALVGRIAVAVQSRSVIVHVPPAVTLALVRVLSWLVKDVLLTRDELAGLMSNLLVTESQPLGKTRLSQWLRDNADTVGATYHSELTRHYR